jgi:hypothetical protein
MNIEPTNSHPAPSGQTTPGVEPPAPPSGAGQEASAEPSIGSTAGSREANLSSVAAALGTDPATLLAALSSNAGLQAALSGPSYVGYGTSLARSVNGGVSFDEYA